MTIPILLITYNRPSHTEIILSAIDKIKPSIIYLASDGPKLNNLQDRLLVCKTRTILKSKVFSSEKKYLFQDKNLGCRKAVNSAIDWFLFNEEMGIILEDDTLPNLSFFNYCNMLLKKYQYNEKIWAIGGNNFQNGITYGDGSYYFSRYNHIWGWATWRRAWQKCDKELKFWPNWKYSQNWNNFFTDKVEKKYWTTIFDQVYANKIDTWDYAFTANMWKNSALSITPNTNLVANIGFGNDATHTKSKKSKFANLLTYELTSIVHPQFLEIHSVADQFTFNNVFNGKWRRFPYSLFLNTYKYFKKLTN